MATWPAYASIQADGYAEEWGDGAVLRTPMESGPPKQMRVKTRRMVMRKATVLITSLANLAAFKTWVASDLLLGADWFTFTDPVDGVSKQARIVGGAVEYRYVTGQLYHAVMTIETWQT